MDAIDKKNVRLAALFSVLAIVCGGLLSSYFLWELVDRENHLLAQLTFLASVLMYLVGGFSLNALVVVLRFGFVRMRKGAVSMIGALVAFALRAIFSFCNVGLIFLSVVGVIETRAELLACIGAVIFFAVVIGGYVFLYRLEKKLKAQRALPITFE